MLQKICLCFDSIFSHSAHLTAVNRATAHPHEERDGTVLNLGSSVIKGKSFYNIIKFPTPKTDADGNRVSPHQQASILGSVAATNNMKPGYFHSFGMTER